MKKIRNTILFMLLLVCFVGCDNTSTEPKGEATKTPVEAQTDVPSTANPVTSTPSPSATLTPTAKPSPTPTPIPKPVANTKDKPLNTFKLDVTLNDKEHKLEVKQILTYCNYSGKELTDIYFNLIPEAFKDNGGGVHMKEITIGKDKCTMEQVKETVYKINLPKPLPAGEKLTINMNYDVNVPKQKDRLGYNNTAYNLGNFIVTPAVYEDTGFSVEPYVNLGDAYYTDIANYYVTFHAPKGYTIAASGTKNKSGVYVAEKVRDFAFCADKSFNTLKDSYDGTELLVYYPGNTKKTAQRIMDTAKKSLKVYNKKLGKYPYKTLTLVLNEMAENIGGMEYPTLVMLCPTPIEKLKDNGVDTSDEELVKHYLNKIDTFTCHEIAHQWFYGLVGNDEVAYPWLDEGLTSFSEYIYFNEYKEDTAKTDVEVYKNEYDNMLEENKSGDKTIRFTETLYKFMRDNPDYYSYAYIRGASLAYQMQQKMGEEQFTKALKEYVEHFSYTFVTPDSYKEFWMSKADFTELFDQFNI